MDILTTKSFDERIKHKGQTLVLFYWDYCKPCMAMKGELEQLSDELNIGTVDVNKELNLVQRYGVVKLPCVILFKDGKEADRLIGYHPIEEIREWLNP